MSEHELPSGAKGLLVHVPGASVTSIMVRFNSGYQFADPSKYEIPHVMEHILATVSQKYQLPNGFVIEAQRNGAYANAHTSSDMNAYVFECADFERERIIDLLEEQLVRPLFRASDVEAELRNVRDELRRSTTEYAKVCNLRLATAAFPDEHQYYDERIAQLDNITVADLQAHYHKTYTAHNARFYIGGDFTRDKGRIIDRLDKIFGQLPGGERQELSRQIGRNLAEPIVQTEPIKQYYYQFSHYAGEIALAERPAASVLRLVLVGGFDSLVLGEARRRGLAYGVGAHFLTSPGNSVFGFSGQVSPDHARELFELIRRHWRDMISGDIESSRVEAARHLGTGSVRRAHQTVGDMLSWYVGSYDAFGVIMNFDDYLTSIEQVTGERVAAVANHIQKPARSALSLVGDLDKVTAEELYQVISGSTNK